MKKTYTISLSKLSRILKEAREVSIVGASAVQLDRLFAQHGFKRSKAKNVRINGQLRGASGFWRKGDCVIYVNSEGMGSRRGVFGNMGILMRLAEDESDYTGGVNQDVKTEDEFHNTVKKLFRQFHGTDANNSSNDVFGSMRFEDGNARTINETYDFDRELEDYNKGCSEIDKLVDKRFFVGDIIYQLAL